MRGADLGVTKLLAVFAGLSVVFLALLAVVPVRSHMTEWRGVQARYNAAAILQGADPVSSAIQQVWKPASGVVDRCTSCHVGMGPGVPLAGEKLFAAHPDVHHDTAEIGCTICHAGQGRATTKEAAHGRVAHWDEPTLERGFAQAGCGTCHSHTYVAPVSADARGAALFRRYDCIACHRLDGAGRGNGPDLSTAGLKGFSAAWHARHLDLKKASKGREWAESYGEIPDADVAALIEYLKTRSGAPALTEAKALAYRAGCRGCHRINGAGGDEGPDLASEGLKAPSEFDFAPVRGTATVANWHAEHFLEPGAIVQGSMMPNLGFTRGEAETLAHYVLSLRSGRVGEAQWPRDRVRGVRLSERDFPADGESIFLGFCSGCHGPRGEGRRYGGQGVVFPAVASADFLTLVSDDFLRRTVTSGRPGRRMPAWGEKEAGLRPAEIDAVVAYLRSLSPSVKAEMPVPRKGDRRRGADLYSRACVGCHGREAAGGEAPALSNSVLLASATDGYLAATILNGRNGTSMRGFKSASASFPALDLSDAADIIAWLRSLAPTVAATKGDR